MKIQVVCLNRLVFLPYIHGLLRSYIDSYEPQLSSILEWDDPIFLDAPAKQIADGIDCDVLALSCYVWNFRKQMKVARLVTERNPNTRVVVGGPHIPNNPEGFFQEHPYVDTIVHGEGEITFSNVLKSILGEDIPTEGVSTATYHEPAKSLFGPKLPKNIYVSSPYHEGYLDSAIEQARNMDLEFWAPWETNRGCPYSCSFCDWGSSLLNKVRKFSLERLGDDVGYFGANQIENVYICDANFGMLQVDEGITHALVRSKETTGYPKQIRGSFAKNSNERVFKITKNLMDAGMIYGTTLSMQSTNKEVLVAVDRENIGVTKYKQLQERYRAEGYHTYTELILGLPEETRETFVSGVCELITAGNHEDIRVWELSVLPNAPMAQHVDRYGLQMVTKNVFLEHPRTSLDEIEVNQIVVETSTMSKDDWVYCYLFAWTIQTLHCGYYTRYISEYLAKEGIRSYQEFYTGLIDDSLKDPNSVLGEMLRKLESLLRKYTTKQSNHLMQKVPGFGFTRRNPSDWLWLSLCNSKREFYAELEVWLQSDWSEALSDLFKFQEQVMLDPSYRPGIQIDVAYDWRSYFEHKENIAVLNSSYVVRQDSTGVDDMYKLSSDPIEFADAAVGTGFMVSRHRHYAHPLNELESIQ